jgi:hypothetical protein
MHTCTYQPTHYSMLLLQNTAPLQVYSKDSVFVPTILAKMLRPHQREGVLFCYQCVMGLRNFKGQGCILADGTYSSAKNNHEYVYIYLYMHVYCPSMHDYALVTL